MKMKQKKKKGKANLTIITEFLHYCTLLSQEFLLFSTIPLSVEMVTPIRTTIAVHLMISFAINTFEDMKTWFTIFGSQTI